MPSSAVRILELKFVVDTTQFNSGIAVILRGLAQVRQSMRQLGVNSITISNSFNTGVSNAFNKTSTSIKHMNNAANQAVGGLGCMGTAANHTTRRLGALFLETKGGIRVFGGEHGLLKAFALVRNHLLLMAFGFGPFIYGLKGAVTASVEFTNAMTGLGAIAKATGEKVDVTQTAAKSLAEKGFMTVTEAAMGLKNLLATGFGLEEAMKVMKGFADSAAFNRQASFQWGEAVVRATEGIRLGLSQVSDAAGITKNLSQILVEQGKSMQDVSKISSDASVRQALLNGLIKEFTLYTGNAELALGTYSGSLSVLKTSLFNLKKEIGDSLVPILGKLVRGLSDSVKEATRWYKINRDIIDLKLQGFIDFAEPIKDFVVFIGKATAAIVDFATENKNLVYTLAALAVLNKVTGIVKALIPHIITLTAALGAFAARVRAVGFITALTVALGPLQLAFIALAAIVTTVSVAFAIFKDRQKDVTEEALKNHAAVMKQTRLYQELIEKRIGVTRAELDGVKAKIELQAATGYLVSEEKRLTTQLEVLEGQAKATNLQMEKLALTQTQIQFGETEKGILSGKFATVRTGGATARGGAGRETISMIDPLRKLYSDLGTQDLYKRIQGTSSQEDWAKRVSEAESAYDKLLTFGVNYYRVLDEKSRENFDKTLAFHNQMLIMAKNQIVAEQEIKNTKTGLTEEELKELKKKQDAYYDLYDKISDKYFKSVSSEFEYKKWALAQEVAEYKQALREMGVSKEQFEKASLLIQETYSLQRKQLLYDELNAMKKPDMKAIREQMGIKELGITPYGRQREEIDTGVVDYATREVERQKKQLEEINQGVQKVTKQVADAYWTERAEIARARDAELDDLRKQLSQGTIDTQEYMARRNQIMTNANIQMANATKNAWKQAGQAAFDTMGQMLTQYITKVAAAKMQTNIMMSLGMSALGGLGVGLLMAGGSYLLSQAFQEKSTVDYQSINPSSSSEAERKRYGSLAAAPVQYINVIPTLNFEAVNGSYILIGSGTVEEFSDEVSELIKNTVNAAIATNEIGLAGLSPQ